MIPRALLEETVYKSCLLLDDEDFDGFLALCAPTFRYRVKTYSPEIRRPMVWLDHDKVALQTLFRNLPRHNSERSRLTRHATVYTITENTTGDEATVVSAFQVIKTTLDGGSSALFAVGKIHDLVRCTEGQPLLGERIIQLETRMLGIGSHIPL